MRYFLLLVGLLVLVSCGEQREGYFPNYNHSRALLKTGATSLDAKLKEHLAAAKERNQKPFIYYTAVWCGPCKRYKEHRGKPEMLEAHRDVYIIEVDLDRIPELAQRNNINLLPTWQELLPDGTGGRKISSDLWQDDVPAEMAPVLSDFFAGKLPG